MFVWQDCGRSSWQLGAGVGLRLHGSQRQLMAMIRSGRSTPVACNALAEEARLLKPVQLWNYP